MPDLVLQAHIRVGLADAVDHHARFGECLHPIVGWHTQTIMHKPAFAGMPPTMEMRLLPIVLDLNRRPWLVDEPMCKFEFAPLDPAFVGPLIIESADGSS